MTREEANGPRKVASGNIVFDNLTLQEAEIIIRDLQATFPVHDYELSGVGPDQYVVIERLRVPEESRYIN